MFMVHVLGALAVLCGTALVAAFSRSSDRVALRVGTLGGVVGCGIGLQAAIRALLHRGPPEDLRLPTRLPVGEVHVAMDALSAFFLLCIFVVAGLAVVYGAGYLRSDEGKRPLASPVAFFNLLVASMAVVVLARDGILFLFAWEVMTLASFFLVIYEAERDEVRRAGTTYLVASQLGVTFVMVLFALLARRTGSFDFDAWEAGGAPPAALASTCFVLALVGFGTKAGFWPVHVWLPEAHPAAPSHVSALMSGVMIKMGIYGILRTLAFLGPPQEWWGFTVLAVGMVSGLIGVLQALGQHDLKRLLAYHSVENIGIIALGIGLGLLGQAHGEPAVAFAGFAGALLHVLNHGLFKGLLFQGAGSVLHATHTRSTDALGGLARRMPWTALTFCVGAAAIAGLPPLNGFASEFLIYLSAFGGSGALPAASNLAALTVIPALALIGGLATACFVKAFGVVFLGEPRTKSAEQAHEVGLAMRGSMVAGALACLAIGLWPRGAIQLLSPAAVALAGPESAAVLDFGALDRITLVAAVLVALVGGLALLRHILLRRRTVVVASTWGCGYAAPTARMQYTGASFAEPLLEPFSAVLGGGRKHHDDPQGYFPQRARFSEHVSDSVGERVLLPAVRWFLRLLARIRVIEQGQIHLYIAYVLATIVLLLLAQVFMFGGAAP